VLKEATVQALQRHWEEGWNGGDLETIMAPFADTVTFTSPFVPTIAGDPAKTSIVGYPALRQYVADALQRVPGIRYTLDATYVTTDAVVLTYTVHLPDGTDKHGADTMRVDDGGKVVEWKSHYHSFGPQDVEGLG
jgi:hypothetical protein